MSIQILDATNLDSFEALEDRVLILGKSDCDNCHRWQSELEAALQAGEFPSEIPVGKLNLDQRGLGDFKRGNTWLADVSDLPFNVIYKSGAIEKSYAGGGLERLMNRLRRLDLVDVK